MIINNIKELSAHMEQDLGCRFYDAVKAEDLNNFYRIIDGKPVDFDVVTWISYTSENAVELGGDLVKNNDFWFSNQFVYPFESELFDSYLFDLEQTDESTFPDEE